MVVVVWAPEYKRCGRHRPTGRPLDVTISGVVVAVVVVIVIVIHFIPFYAAKQELFYVPEGDICRTHGYAPLTIAYYEYMYTQSYICF